MAFARRNSSPPPPIPLPPVWPLTRIAPSFARELASRSPGGRRKDGLSASPGAEPEAADGDFLSLKLTAKLAEGKLLTDEERAALVGDAGPITGFTTPAQSPRGSKVSAPADASAGDPVPPSPATARDLALVGAALARMRDRRAVVQCFASAAAAELVTGALHAAGATPARVVALEEAAEFVEKRADALCVDLDSLTAASLEAMLSAAAAAACPWALDPTGCGDTAYRMSAARALLSLSPALVRGSAADIFALTTGAVAEPSGAGATEVLRCATALARTHGCVVVVSGVTDYVTNGTLTLAVGAGADGAAPAARLRQLGVADSALSALLAAFVACADLNEDPHSEVHCAAAGCAFFKVRAHAGWVLAPRAPTAPHSPRIRPPTRRTKIPHARR